MQDARDVGEELDGDQVSGHPRTVEGIQDDDVSEVLAHGGDPRASVDGPHLDPGTRRKRGLEPHFLGELGIRLTDDLRARRTGERHVPCQTHSRPTDVNDAHPLPRWTVDVKVISDTSHVVELEPSGIVRVDP